MYLLLRMIQLLQNRPCVLLLLVGRVVHARFQQLVLAPRRQHEHDEAAEEGCRPGQVRQQHEQHDGVQGDAEQVVDRRPGVLRHVLPLDGAHGREVDPDAHLEDQEAQQEECGIGGERGQQQSEGRDDVHVDGELLDGELPDEHLQ